MSDDRKMGGRLTKTYLLKVRKNGRKDFEDFEGEGNG
jgi:hypothetical protein